MVTKAHKRSMVLWLGGLVALGGVVALVAAALRGRGATVRAGGWAQSAEEGAPAEALAMMVIPGFTLADQDGAAVSEDIFRGGLTILAFSFTNCPAVCPIMHGHLIRLLHGALADTPVRIVTISVDPRHDTPEALRVYGERLGIDAKRWRMLTGDEGTIHAIVRSMKFAIGEDASLTVTLANGERMANITHPSKLVLVGPEGKVIGLESGLEWEAALRLGERAKELAARLTSDRH